MRIGRIMSVVLTVVFASGLAWAQQANVAAKLGYPQMIVYNGKVVTMDDASFESKVGTIGQAGVLVQIGLSER